MVIKIKGLNKNILKGIKLEDLIPLLKKREKLTLFNVESTNLKDNCFDCFT